MRGVKWYRKLAELFLDVSVCNSFIAWSNRNPFTKMTHLTFRKKLIPEIIIFHSSGSRPPQTGPKTTVDSPLRLSEKHYRLCIKNCFKVYYTVLDHKREDDPRVDHALGTCVSEDESE